MVAAHLFMDLRMHMVAGDGWWHSPAGFQRQSLFHRQPVGVLGIFAGGIGSIRIMTPENLGPAVEPPMALTPIKIWLGRAG